jgi:hypothetical protein
MIIHANVGGNFYIDYMKGLQIFMMTLLLFEACSSHTGRGGDKSKDFNNKIIIAITQKVVQENCVVFLMPDSQILSKMRKEKPEDAYNEMISDIQWYQDIASETLDTLKIKCEFEHDCELKFLQKNGKDCIIRTSNIKGDMILFRNDSTPKISYAIQFDKDSILSFFKK